MELDEMTLEQKVNEILTSMREVQRYLIEIQDFMPELQNSPIAKLLGIGKKK